MAGPQVGLACHALCGMGELLPGERPGPVAGGQPSFPRLVLGPWVAMDRQGLEEGGPALWLPSQHPWLRAWPSGPPLLHPPDTCFFQAGAQLVARRV